MPTTTGVVTTMKTKCVLAALLLATAGCADSDETSELARSSTTSGASSPTTSSPEPTGVPDLEDGPVTPGRYRFTIPIPTECGEGDPIGCPEESHPPGPLDLEVTVPDGWQHWREFVLLTPDGDDSPTEAPDGAALVMGWTTFHVGLSSDPCLARNHQVPDVEVGPSVDDFVDAVQAQKALDVTRPVDARVGGHRAQFFSLEAPADLSGCEEWRPWDPGFYAQGPSNIWDVWVVDVDGDRVLIVTDYFPGTPAETVAQLGEMVESIEFLP